MNMEEKRERLGYMIPVKIMIEPGRYRYGFVKSLTPDTHGNVRIMYGNGRISTRSAESCIHEPQGFKPINQ